MYCIVLEYLHSASQQPSWGIEAHCKGAFGSISSKKRDTF